MDDCRKGPRALRCSCATMTPIASGPMLATRPSDNKALDEANARDWTVVVMKSDWQRVFPFEQNVSRAVWKETRVASR